MKRIIMLITVVCLSAGCHRGVVKEDAAAPANEDRIDVSADVDGLDDPLETDVKIKTGSISIWKWKFAGNGDQSFLRGYINKATLAPTYQVYVEIRDFAWRHWDTARYVTPAGVKEMPLVSAGKDVECGRSHCIYSEDMVLDIDKATLEAWSHGDTKVRIASTSVGGNVDIEIDSEESQNLLGAMDQVARELEKKKVAP